MCIMISYEYRRGGESITSGGRGGSLPEHMSRHHIIAYPRMYYLGVLSLVYLKMKKNNKRPFSYELNFLESVVGIQNHTISTCLEKVNKNKSGVWSIPTHENTVNESLYRIAWMPMNLFTGPSAKLRLDDPDQNNDKIPLSMKKERRTAIENIEKALSHYGKQYIPHTGGSSESIEFHCERDFDKLMHIFFYNIQVATDCYESKVSDWFIKVTEDCKWSRGKTDKFYVSKNASLPEMKNNGNNGTNGTTVSAKFGLISSKEDMKGLARDIRYGILSKGNTGVNGVIKYEDRTYDTELNKPIRSVLT